MDTATKMDYNLKPQEGDCCCCLSKGKFMSVDSRPGKGVPTYAEMLLDTLNINLSMVPTVLLICRECARQLRQARSFRRQVLSSQALLDQRAYVVIVKEEVEPKRDEDSESSDIDYGDDAPLNTIPQAKQKVLKDENKIKDRSYNTPRTKVIKCDYCYHKFRSKMGKKKHLETCRWRCRECDLVFKTGREVEDHWKLHSVSISVRCSICDEKFDSRIERANHISRTHGYKCCYCSERYLSHDMYKHKVEIHGRPMMQCGICESKFYTKSKLIKHQRIVHLKEKRLSCPHCNFKCFENTRIKNHMLVHGAEKKHACRFCGKLFVRMKTLQFHERIHTGDKRYVCKICSKAFVQTSNLKYHMAKHHPADV